MIKRLSIMIMIVCVAGVVFGQWIEVPRVRPEIETYPLEITESSIELNIQGQFARVDINQTFYNPTAGNVEGTYMFPIPLDVVVSDFAMWVDGKRLEPRLLDAQEALKIYESYVRRSKDPALLRYVNQKLLQVNIFPIPPKSSRKIHLSYRSQVNIFDKTYQSVVPIKVPQYCLAKAISNFRIKVHIEQNSTIYNVYSPSFVFRNVIDQVKMKEYSYESNNYLPQDNLFVYFTMGSMEAQMTIMTYKPNDDNGFFFLSLDPGSLPRDKRETAPRTILLVLDISGSMESDNKIEQVREAAQFAVGRLEEQDQFNIITFSEQIESFADGLVPANRENRQKAASFVRTIYTGGGTNINDALRAALHQIKSAEHQRPTYIIFMTDGIPTVGEVNLQTIMNKLTDEFPKINMRMFVFGVGYDVNAAFLQELALKFRGAADFIEPFENLEHRMSSFFAKILQPAIQNPVLTVRGSVTLVDYYPNPLPDVFYGSPLTIAGRYRGSGNAEIEIKGESGKTIPNNFKNNFTMKESDTTDSFIGPLWASRKVGYLLRQIKIKGEQPELVNAVKDLSLKYGILTPYTAFLVEEPQVQRRAQGIPDGILVPKPSEGKLDKKENSKPEAEVKYLRDSHTFHATLAASPGSDSSASSVKGSKKAEQLANTEVVTEKDQSIRTIGTKTFKLHNGTWIDIHVKFGSDEYFKLLSSSKDLAQYFALGQKLIVVFNSRIYFIE